MLNCVTSEHAAELPPGWYGSSAGSAAPAWLPHQVGPSSGSTGPYLWRRPLCGLDHLPALADPKSRPRDDRNGMLDLATAAAVGGRVAGVSAEFTVKVRRHVGLIAGRVKVSVPLSNR